MPTINQSPVIIACKLLLISCSLFSAVTSFSAQSLEVAANGLAGVASNPHQLAESLTPQAQNYLLGEIRANDEYFELLHISAAINKIQFNDDPRADKFESEFGLVLQSDFSIASYQFEYDIVASQLQIDQTYVDANSGLVASFNGFSLADRFDLSETQYGAGIAYQTEQDAKFYLSYLQQKNQYEQLLVNGLSNLDFKRGQILFKLDYQMSDQGQLKFEAGSRSQDFIDRRGKDLDGLDILDSQLRLSFNDFSVAYYYQPDAEVSWQYQFQYSARKDNASGFWNADQAEILIATHYQWTQYHQLNAEFSLSKFNFENSVDPTIIAIDSRDKQRRGVSLSIDYQWIFGQYFDSLLALYVKLQSESHQSNLELNEFQSDDMAIGIRWTL